MFSDSTAVIATMSVVNRETKTELDASCFYEAFSGSLEEYYEIVWRNYFSALVGNLNVFFRLVIGKTDSIR